jgi:hypothetical protein
VVNAAQGDRAYVVQETTDQVGSLSYRRLDEVCVLDDLTLAEGTANAIGCDLKDIPQDLRVTFDFRRSSFEAVRTSVHPLATHGLNSALYLKYVPLGTAYGYIELTPYLLSFTPSWEATDLNTGPMEYGNPFGGGAVMGRIVHSYKVAYQYQGAAPFIQTAAMESRVTLDAVDGKPITPMLSPVRNPNINGVSAFQPQSGVGPHPVITWSPPATGIANGHWVHVFQLGQKDGATTATLIAYLLTGGTSVMVPYGVMTPGNTYFFMIRSRYNPDYDISKTPFQFGLPSASADVLTEPVTY